MRTILADSDTTVRNALGALLTQGLDMQVVGEADSVATLQQQVQRERPDLVVVAWKLIAGQAETLLAGLQAASRGLRIVVLGLRPDTRHAALTAGADGYISMVDAPEEVARVLRDGASDTKSTRPGGLS